MDTDGFMVYMKRDYVYKDIAEDVETRFDSLNYELDHQVKEKKLKCNWINEK